MKRNSSSGKPKFVYWIEVNDDDVPPQICLFKVDKVYKSSNPDGTPITLYHNKTYNTTMNAEYCYTTLEEAYVHFSIIEDELKKSYNKRTH